jgi:hypothetical protein
MSSDAAVTLDPALALVLRGALALVLGSAALHKLRDLRAFHAVVEAYRLAPPAATGAVAAAVVSGEVVACAALLAPGPAGASLAGPLLAAALFALYALAIGVNLARGRTHLDCGCGGPAARQPIRPWLVARNAALVAAACLALAPVAARALVWVDVLTVFGALVVLAAAWTSLHRLAAEPLAFQRSGRKP